MLTMSTATGKARKGPVPGQLDFSPPQQRRNAALDHAALRKLIKRGQEEVFYTVLCVTPDVAQYFLARNPQNRTLKLSAIAQYVGAMKRGEWTLNGEDIIIAKTGELNDGQNRLTAVIQSGLTIPMGFKFGIERETRGTVDLGARRSAGDYFQMAGELNGNRLAAALRILHGYDNGLSLNYAASNEQLEETLNRNPLIREAITFARPLVNTFRVACGEATAAAYVCARIDQPLTARLIENVVDGLNITERGSPIYRLRERFQEHDAKRKPLVRTEAAALFIIAFNAMANRRNLRSLTWIADGPDAEPFPRAVGKVR